MIKAKVDITNYFYPWEGWYCIVEDENGNSCGEVIGCNTGDLIEHLKKKHGIEVEFK